MVAVQDIEIIGFDGGTTRLGNDTPIEFIVLFCKLFKLFNVIRLQNVEEMFRKLLKIE
jgi:hypothetical protein